MKSLLYPRSVLITAVILSLAAGAHVLGGGVLPEGPILAVLAALILLPVVVLGTRAVSFTGLVGVLGGGQVLLHAAFAAFSGSQHCSPTITAWHAHHTDSLAVHCVGMESGASVAYFTPEILSPMTAAHLLAVIITAWVIARGERALEHVGAWVSTRVPDTNPVLPAPVSPGQALRAAPEIARPWRNIRPRSQRGPPTYADAEHFRLSSPMPA